MKSLTFFLSSLPITLLLPGLVMAGDSCDQAASFCSDTTAGIKSLIADPNCRADSSCVKCVGDALGGSQISSYCSAYQSTGKGKTKQTISAVMYDVSAAVCLTSCFLSKTVYGTAAGVTLGRLCSGLGLGAAAWDFVSSLSANDPSGLVMGAVSFGTAAANSIALTGKIAGEAGKTSVQLKAKSQTGACLTGVLYTGLAVVKHISLAKMNKAKREQCDIVGQFGSSAKSAVMACTAANSLTTNSDPSTGQGFTFATPETFNAFTLADGAQHLGATASDQFIKDMGADLQKASDIGKWNIGDIAKQVDNGASASDAIAAAGLPPEMSAAVKDIEKRILSGEKFKTLDELGGGYTAGAGSTLGANTPANGDLTFGATAAPGEGAASLDIDRKPAEAEVTLDGDVFHGAFGGTIFEIITHRLKAQKGNYAELVPEGRMNRLFNGYRDTASKPKKSVK